MMTRLVRLHRTLPLAFLGLAACSGAGDDAEPAPPEAEAATVSSALGTAYDRCGVTIRGTENSAGQYFLTADLTASGRCITINAPGKSISLDCAGHSLTSMNGSPTEGIIDVQSGNVALTNCAISGPSTHVVVFGGSATILGGSYGGPKAPGQAPGRLMVYAGSLTILGGTFRGLVFGAKIHGGDFSLPGGNPVEGAAIFAGNFHDSAMGTRHSNVYGGNFYRNGVGVEISAARAVTGGRFYSNDVGVRVNGASATISSGTFFGNNTDLLVTNAGSARVDGGQMCDSGKTNIRVTSGTITGDEDSSRARCRQVSPAGIYLCNPCP
jgi:hypothetical protein